MPRRRPRRREPRIPDAILDQLLAGADPKTAFDPNGLLDDLKALAERALKPRWITLSLAKEEPATAATAMAVRRWSPTPASGICRSRAIGRPASIPLLRHSLEFVASKDRKAVAAALKDIYRAVDATAGEAAERL